MNLSRGYGVTTVVWNENGAIVLREKVSRSRIYARTTAPLRLSTARESQSLANSVMDTFLKIFIVVVLALAFIGWLADRRAAAKRPDVTPGLSLLPGDIKYESPNGNVRVYFPIVTSIVLSVLLTLILRLFS